MKKFFKFFRKGLASTPKDLEHPYDAKVNTHPILWFDSEMRGLAESFTQFILGAFVIVLASYASYVVLSDPGNFPGVIASLLVDIARQTKQFDFSILLPSFAIANIILLSLVVFVLFLMSGMWSARPASQGDLEDLRDYIRKSNNIDGLIEALDDIQNKLRVIAGATGISLDEDEADEKADERTTEPG